MDRSSLCLGLMTFLIHLCHVNSYENGAPDRSCMLLQPSHGAIPQTFNAPYEMQFQRFMYRPNEEVYITLSGMKIRDEQFLFKGFLAVAQRTDTLERVGTWISFPRTKTTCEGGSGITHADPHPKQTITVVWKPPPEPVGDVIIMVTYVQDKKTFWVRTPSPTLKPTTQPGPPPPEVTNPTVPPTMETTVSPFVPKTDPTSDEETDPPTDEKTDPPTDEKTDPTTDQKTDPLTDKKTDPPTDGNTAQALRFVMHPFLLLWLAVASVFLIR